MPICLLFSSGFNAELEFYVKACMYGVFVRCSNVYKIVSDMIAFRDP